MSGKSPLPRAYNPLHDAAKSGDVGKVRKLLESGKYEVNGIDSVGRAPLHHACYNGHMGVVGVLLSEFGADLTIRNSHGATAVMLAAGGGHEHVVRALLSEYHCPVDATNTDGSLNTALHYACGGGNKDVIKILMEQSPLSIEVRNNKQQTPLDVLTEYDDPESLHSACEEGNVSLVRTLILKFKADVTARNECNSTPLHVAALYGKEEVVLALINEFKCDPNENGAYGQSLLHYACEGGNVDLVKTLVLYFKADVNARDEEHWTPLHVAAFNGHERVVVTLIKNLKCDPNIKGLFGRSLLHFACGGGNISLVTTLIRRFKFDVNIRDEQNSTPLHMAALGGKEDIVLALVQQFKCDPNEKGTFGRSLLHYACQGGNVSMIKTIVVHLKADVNAQDEENSTPLHVAAFHGRDEVVLSLIKDLKCDLNKSGLLGQSVLHYACWGGNTSLVRTLMLQCEVDGNIKDERNTSPLHLAAIHGREELVLALIKLKCDVNAKGKYNRSLLHYACQGGNVSLVKRLVLEFKADVHARDEQNSTPLHLAAFSGKEELVLVLINDFKCDPNEKGWFGRSLLHYACQGGHVSLVETLVLQFNADFNARDEQNSTPLLTAALGGKNEAIIFIKNPKCDPNMNGLLDRSLLHYACYGGNVNLVKALIHQCKFDANTRDEQKSTPLHVAALCGKEEVALALINEFKCDPNENGFFGQSLLHYACGGGNVSLVKALILQFKADVTARDERNNTPFHVAASCGKEEVVLALINNFKCDPNENGWQGRSLLHCTCQGGNISLLKTLIPRFKANLNARDEQNSTPIHLAAFYGEEEMVLALIKFKCDFNKKGHVGRSLLHYACQGGNVSLVRTLILQFKADVHARDEENSTPLHAAALGGKEEVVLTLIHEFECDPNEKGGFLGQSTLLHYACEGGNVSLVKTLIVRFKADTNAQNEQNNTPLRVAAIYGKEEVVSTLKNEFKCDSCLNGSASLDKTVLAAAALYGKEELVLASVNSWNPNEKNQFGLSLLHYACHGGNVSLVKKLILQFKADVHARDEENSTPLHMAALGGKEKVVLVLINEFKCDPNEKGHLGQSLLHYACQGDNIDLVKTLVLQFKADVNVRDEENSTPLHMAALCGKKEVVLALINDLKCDIAVKNTLGRSLLHNACHGGNISLIKTLILQFNADVNARDKQNNTPLHIAAKGGKEEVVVTLIEQFNCQVNSRGYLGRSFLHSACASGKADVVMAAGQYMDSQIKFDDKGDTPLHLASAFGDVECVKELLYINSPVLVYNANGKTPIDFAKDEIKVILEDYMTKNSDHNRLYEYFNDMQNFARKYSTDVEHFTRVFVIGNPGAGKSSLVETLRREGFLAYFWRVSESSVSTHTAGIVPSIHTSKHYGRVMFYDFAGDPEYYSSHAAILENLVSRKGHNIVIIVIDLRDNNVEIKNNLYYWIAFIQYHKFTRSCPSFILVGSHCDQIEKKMLTEKCQEFSGICQFRTLNRMSHFVLNCCQPKSQAVTEVQEQIHHLTSHSHQHKLSFESRLLLGILEKDFINATIAFPLHKLQDHIRKREIHLYANMKDILYELHDVGLLFVVANDNNFHIVLNLSQLTNKVHQALFSKKASEKLEKMGCTNGMIPQPVLKAILPDYITEQCLVQLQYCQEVSSRDALAFPSLAQSNSDNQSHLFFPALCTADKSELTTPPHFNHSIGWQAQCNDPYEYFPARFLHVLILRLVFGFTLEIPPEAKTPHAASDHSHYQRRCTVWKTGVQWLMEEGVECMVELVKGGKGVLVLTKSTEDTKEDCISVFGKIIDRVMDAKTEFCDCIKLYFFLLNSSDLSKDNLFAMSEVKEILTGRGKNIIVSVSGKRTMECSKLLPLRRLTHWFTFFPMNFHSVLGVLEKIVRNLYKLGLFLDISIAALDAIEDNFPTNVERRRRQLVRVWLSSSKNVPCWWKLVEALKQVKETALAEKLQKEHDAEIKVQKILLSNECKPTRKFLMLFADVASSERRSLPTVLSLTSQETLEAFNAKGASPRDQTLQMLQTWAAREDATYGELRLRLNNSKLFQYT